MEGQSRFIDTAKLNLRAIVDQRDFKALFHLPSWDLIAELLHQLLHHVVTLGVNHERCHVVKGRLLQIYNDEPSSIHGALLREGVCWRDS